MILADRLGPADGILTMLEIKGQVLHRVRVHLKVPGWLSDLKALLTRKFPMFLSRLNEISGGREKMSLVSGSLRRILKFLKITFLTARFVDSCTYVQVCTQMRKLRFLRKIAKIVNGAKKKTNPQLGLAIFSKIAIFAIFCKNR